MKKLILIILIPALSFMVSCGGSDGDGIMSQMKKMKEVADNAQEMQKEMEADPESQDKMFPESTLSKMDLAQERMISDEEWARVQKTVNAFTEMDSTQLAGLNDEKISAFYSEQGYSSTEEGQAEMKKIGELAQKLIDLGMHFVALKQVYLVDGKEAYDKKIVEYATELKNDGYSKEDLQAIEKNADLEGKALVLFFTLESYNEIKAISQAVDSLDEMQHQE